MNPETTLSSLLAEASLPPLDPDVSPRFDAYLALLLKWNARVNLTAVRDADGILRRHFVESIACAHALPPGIRTLLDYGSGAGFPGIPIALMRPEIAVTLAESQGKKAAFLREASRTLQIPFSIYDSRAESLDKTFDCVTLRAVDRMPDAVRFASGLVSPNGFLVLLTTRAEFETLQSAAQGGFEWKNPSSLPFGADRVLAIGFRSR